MSGTTAAVAVRLRIGSSIGTIRPRIYLGESRRVVADFADELTGASVTPGAVEFSIRRPDGAVLVVPADQVQGSGASRWVDIGLHQVGAWSARVTCAEPSEAAAERGWDVIASAVTPAADSPPWVDPVLGEIQFPSGMPVAATRLDAMPPAVGVAGLTLPGVQDGQGRAVPFESLEAAAKAAAQEIADQVEADAAGVAQDRQAVAADRGIVVSERAATEAARNDVLEAEARAGSMVEAIQFIANGVGFEDVGELDWGDIERDDEGKIIGGHSRDYLTRRTMQFVMRRLANGDGRLADTAGTAHLDLGGGLVRLMGGLCVGVDAEGAYLTGLDGNPRLRFRDGRLIYPDGSYEEFIENDEWEWAWTDQVTGEVIAGRKRDGTLLGFGGDGSSAPPAVQIPAYINSIVAEGDSMTASNRFGSDDAGWYAPVNGPLTWACFLARQRMTVEPHNVLAVSGNFTSDMVQRIPLLRASTANMLALRPGRNDADQTGSNTLANTLGNIDELVQAALETGKRVALHLIGPKAPDLWDQTNPDRLNRSRFDAAINNHMVRWQRLRPDAIHIVDARGDLTDPATGGWIEGASYDGTHEYPLAAYWQGRRFYEATEKYLPPGERGWVQRWDRYHAEWNPCGNKLVNPALDEGSPATVSSGPLVGSQIPAGWTAGHSSGTLTAGSVGFSIEEDDRLGSALVFEAVGAQGAAQAADYYIQQTLTMTDGAYQAGERLEGTLAIQFGANMAGVCAAGQRVVENDGATTRSHYGMQQRYAGHHLPNVDHAISGLDRTFQIFTVRAANGTATLIYRIWIKLDLTVPGGASCRIRLSRPCLRRMSSAL